MMTARPVIARALGYHGGTTDEPASDGSLPITTAPAITEELASVGPPAPAGVAAPPGPWTSSATAPSAGPRGWAAHSLPEVRPFSGRVRGQSVTSTRCSCTGSRGGFLPSSGAVEVAVTRYNPSATLPEIK